MIQLTKEEIDAIEKDAKSRYKVDADSHLGKAIALILQEGYIAGATSERIKAKELEEKAGNVLLLCEENGKPVDGFRFREFILELKQALLNYNKP